MKFYVIGKITCMDRGTYKTGWGREQGSFLSVQVFFYRPGLNFDCSDMV